MNWSCMKTLSLILTVLFAVSCQKAVRNTVYSAYETVGIQKRDLLKSRVDKARDEQKEAGEDFKDALEKLKSLYGFKGGALEKKYKSVKSSYEDAEEQAKKVRESIRTVEVTASDLFEEWEKEISQMKTASLKSQSRTTLAQTKERYEVLHTSLKKSESRMQPVLDKLKDQVLYLKHNLNAQAIGSLKGEASNIEKDIEKLLQEMNASISEADQFIKQME